MLLASFLAFKVGGDRSSDAAATPPTKSEVVAPEAKDVKQSNNPSSGALGTEESISGFIAQVSSLVKWASRIFYFFVISHQLFAREIMFYVPCRLVDSRDIVELQLKQLDCEVLIRKREALPQPTPPTPATFMHSHASTAVPPSQSVPAPASSLAPAVSSSSTSPSAVKSAKSSLPPLKCPMAGTFYRSPAPGEPAFVKVKLFCLVVYLDLNDGAKTLLKSCCCILCFLSLCVLLHEFLSGWRQGTEGRSFMHHWGHEIDEWDRSKFPHLNYHKKVYTSKLCMSWCASVFVIWYYLSLGHMISWIIVCAIVSVVIAVC